VAARILNEWLLIRHFTIHSGIATIAVRIVKPSLQPGGQYDQKRRKTMSKPETIKIDEVEYVRKDSISLPPQPTGKIRIVILQRGWVAVGYFSQKDNSPNCILEKASIIRRWGTTKGLGEIAIKGPLPKTILDPVPNIIFHELTAIAMIGCDENVWRGKL
jgi:hypothetical protein